MNSIECPSFNRCSASLCPLDEESMVKGIWYPDEPICIKRGCIPERYRTVILNQRKIQTRARDSAGAYVSTMLERKITVRSGIRGIPPDDLNETSIKRWIMNHKGRIKQPPEHGYFRSIPIETEGFMISAEARLESIGAY